MSPFSRIVGGRSEHRKGASEAIEKVLVRLSDLAMHHPEIVERDIHSLLAHAREQGATVADCRMILTPVKDQADA